MPTHISNELPLSQKTWFRQQAFIWRKYCCLHWKSDCSGFTEEHPIHTSVFTSCGFLYPDLPSHLSIAVYHLCMPFLCLCVWWHLILVNEPFHLARLKLDFHSFFLLYTLLFTDLLSVSRFLLASNTVAHKLSCVFQDKIMLSTKVSFRKQPVRFEKKHHGWFDNQHVLLGLGSKTSWLEVLCLLDPTTSSRTHSLLFSDVPSSVSMHMKPMDSA